MAEPGNLQYGLLNSVTFKICKILFTCISFKNEFFGKNNPLS